MSALNGKKILITRGKGQSEEFRRLLAEGGATPTEIPLIEIRPLKSPQLQEACTRIAHYDWIVFTSANGVRTFAGEAEEAGNWPPIDKPPRLAVVGPGTQAALADCGAEADLLARRHRAEGLVEAFEEAFPQGLEDQRILLPLAARARPLLSEELAGRGARVEVVPVYDTVPAMGSRESLRRLLQSDPPDLVTLASSYTARCLLELAGSPELLDGIPCAAIGPLTARTARQLGLHVAVQPSSSTIPALVEAIADHFRRDSA